MWHFHKSASSEVVGRNRYMICRCGARRVMRLGPGYSAIMTGWPKPRIGWVKNDG